MICYFTDRLLDVTKSEICAMETRKAQTLKPIYHGGRSEENINNGVLRKMMDLFCTIRTVNLLTLSNRRGRRGQKPEGQGTG